MIRTLLIMSVAAALSAGAATAQTYQGHFIPPDPTHPAPSLRGGPLDLAPRYAYEVPGPPGRERQVEQLLRWGAAGKCVVARDPEASLSYVSARPRSAEAAAAAKRLHPAFASCLAGSGIVERYKEAFRRAALADALGVAARAVSRSPS